MITKSASNLKIPYDEIGPEDWHLTAFGAALDFAISRDSMGNIISRASDFVWDLSTYHPRKQLTNFYFVYWTDEDKFTLNLSPERVRIIREMQYLLCHLLYGNTYQIIGVVTLSRYMYTLKKMACYAESKRISILGVFSNPLLMDEFIRNLSITFSKPLERMIAQFSKCECHFEMVLPYTWKSMCQHNKRILEQRKQTAPIPTRIYSEVITRLENELTVIEANLDGFINVLLQLIGIYETTFPMTRDSLKQARPDFERLGIKEFLTRYGNKANLRGICGLINHIFIICKLQIHLFTGMRDSEVNHLPFNCMHSEENFGKKYAFVKGITTKLNNGKYRQAIWVTTEVGAFRAIKIMQKIATVIYQFLGINPKSTNSNNLKLFVSTGYLPWVDRHEFKSLNRTPIKIMSSMGRLSDILTSMLLPLIEEDDIAELEEIEPFRDWISDPEFQVGSNWAIKTHQFRRSLALYARASGSVQTASVRRQLQQISNDMANYYSNGCVFAQKFFEEDPKGFSEHFISDWQDTREESELLNFINDVFDNDEQLFGGAGNFYFHQKSGGRLLSRGEALDAIKSGRMSYKATPVGGCTKTGPCDKNMGLALTSIVCVTENCKSMVGTHSKIVQIINSKKSLLGKLSTDSIEHKIESEELEALEKVEVKWRTSLTSNIRVTGR